jgi:hypothetical protein
MDTLILLEFIIDQGELHGTLKEHSVRLLTVETLIIPFLKNYSLIKIYLKNKIYQSENFSPECSLESG